MPRLVPAPTLPNTPNYGIYGSAPTATATPFTCGTPTKVNLQTYPVIDDGINITLPLNGYKNFNFYYTEDGNGFLAGGGYTVTYLNSSGTNCFGSGDIVSYSPNSSHTNGVQVRPFYGGLTTPRGVHGIFLAKIPGGGGATTPLANATVSLGQSGYFPNKEKTNGIGYYSIYYSSFNPADFFPYSPATYDWRVSGILGFDVKCTYSRDDRMGDVIWVPLGGYIVGAEYDLGTIILTSSTPGCQP
jgi:hypothetical protein